MQLPHENSEGSDDHKKASIEAFLIALNDAWLDQNFEELYAYFSKDCVLLAPSGNETLTGVEAMVDSYRQFSELAHIHDFSVMDIQTYTRSDLAVCHVSFEIDYELGDERHIEQGMEIYVLSVTGSYLQVVWRTQKALGEMPS